MKILGIETSCDDTCASVIELKDEKDIEFLILSDIISSQIEVHKEWGGVYPSLARREHQKNLTSVLKESLGKSKLLKKKKSKEVIDRKPLEEILQREESLTNELIEFLSEYEKPDLNLIAVTSGPGLEPSLWTGINFTKALSSYWEIPIIPINHIEAHLTISFFSLDNNLLKINSDKDIFPGIGLIVSGGHTQLVLIKGIGDYKIIGETRDDAAGECFDKTARILGMEYPGGPEIAQKAAEHRGGIEISLPRPMTKTKNYDFSFSGLKTAVLYHHRSVFDPSEEYIRAMSYEIQQAIIDILIEKTLRAVNNFKAKSIILGGGVTSNKELQKQFIEKKDPKTKIFFPPAGSQMDNALMVAVVGYLKKKNSKKYKLKEIKANSNLKI